MKIEYISMKHEEAISVINRLNIFRDLSEYDPTLCGTIPLGIDVEQSDLDIIMEVHRFEEFKEKIQNLYGSFENFSIKIKTIRDQQTIIANFWYEGFEFELFGQSNPVHKQYAYLHMVIEQEILKQNSKLKKDIITLKQNGYKTEPAFCKVLGLSGDSYEALIEYGKKQSYI
ncbi:DUF4269 domain-containing protein [Piscibacillus halophilus]|uniref:DUF4269 domain-containing protein n=1 Tax=Piscibacillus halophilus TaxID=571933 RepID=UPI00240A1C50|nr:DUF4269 domain-containing protein [Piscibacillus halophilus]